MKIQVRPDLSYGFGIVLCLAKWPYSIACQTRAWCYLRKHTVVFRQILQILFKGFSKSKRVIINKQVLQTKQRQTKGESILENCFPCIKVKLFTRDPPFMSRLVKHLLNLRKKATRKQDFEIRNRLQEKINSLIRENQMRAVSNRNIKNTKQAQTR